MGKHARAFGVLEAFRGDATLPLSGTPITTDIFTELLALQATYATGSAEIKAIADGLATQALAGSNSLSTYLGNLRDAATALLIAQVNADVPLVSRDKSYALVELIRQIVVADSKVPTSSVGATATAGAGNSGNGKIVVSVLDQLGRSSQNVLAETILGTVTSGGTAGSERIHLAGEAAVDKLSPLWPAGSGAAVDLTSSTPGASTNKVTNGTFETFTVTNTPDNWTVDVGTIGTTILESSSSYSGSKCLSIVGNGSQLTGISQSLTGLVSLQPYAVNFFAKMVSSPAAGVLTVDLYDGSSVIADDSGTNNSFTVDLTTLGTSFVAKGGVFRLPEPIPSTVKLRLRLSTAIENTKILRLDHLDFGAMTEIYAHGPWAKAFSGATPFSIQDLFSIAVTNDRAGQWQEWFERFFDMRSSRLLLPTSGTTTIADSLTE